MHACMCNGIYLGADMDYVVANIQDLNQTFTSGIENGILCLAIQTLPDQDIEDPEIFSVSINSTDVAVRFINDTSVVTIEDSSFGKHFLQALLQVYQWRYSPPPPNRRCVSQFYHVRNLCDRGRDGSSCLH